MRIYIINPDNGKRVSVEDWRKEADPTRARILAIDTDEGYTIMMSKEYKPGEFIVAENGNPDTTFRIPTILESIIIHKALYWGLYDAIKLIRGNNTKTDRVEWGRERGINHEYYPSSKMISRGGGFEPLALNASIKK